MLPFRFDGIVAPSLRILFTIFALGISLAALAGCPGAHKQPTGPAPEYEDPPPPSWLKDGGGPVTAPPSPLDMILSSDGGNS